MFTLERGLKTNNTPRPSADGLPAWARLASFYRRVYHNLVSIHAPAWGATRDKRFPGVISAVSIHAPAWGATPNDFNRIYAVQEVSIHAPAWGATPPECLFCIPEKVSIHAPAWGATYNHLSFTDVSMFQFTRPRGARQPLWGILCFKSLSY